MLRRFLGESLFIHIFPMNKNIVSLSSQRLKSLCRIWLDILKLSSEMHFMNKHGVCVFFVQNHCICTAGSVIGKYHWKSTVYVRSVQ